MSAIISGVIGGLAAGLAALAVRTRKGASPDRHGWSQLRPGWYLHLALMGCLAMVAVIGAFFSIGGSARIDAGEQNLMALLLMLAFAGSAAWVLWYGYLRKIEWKGDDIRVTSPFGRVAEYRFSDVQETAESMDGFQFRLRMKDSRTLRVSMYSHGFQEFMERLSVVRRS